MKKLLWVCLVLLVVISAQMVFAECVGGYPNGIREEGEDCDDFIFNEFSDGGCCHFDCTFEPSNVLCRGADGACDKVEYCTGASAICPANDYLSSTDVCRPATKICDVQELCTGEGPDCPEDQFQDAGLTCRPAFGVCDLAEVCTGLSADCPTDLVRDSGYVCAQESGQCDADDTCDGTSKICNENYAPLGTSCDDGLFCNIGETCDGEGACSGGSGMDCSQNDISAIGTCDYNPDNIHFTWDNRSAFESVCDEGTDSCTTGDYTISHQAPTKGVCDVACLTNSDCNYLDMDYCEGTAIFHEEGVCGEDYQCHVAVNQVQECNDGLWCNGQESCSAAQCVAGTIVDCSGNNIAGISTCTYDPDNNDYTLDTRPFFTSQCVEDDQNTGHCTTGNYTISHQEPTIGECGVECLTDENCNYIDRNYCDGTAILHDEGVCEADYKCHVHTEQVQECNDGLWCNGQETCSAAQCHPGAAPDCSTNNLPSISTCNNNPDTNPLTWDNALGFTSTCDELNDRCTTSTYSYTHTCDMSRCSAECESSGDCRTKCVGNLYYSGGSCTSGCTCNYDIEDCDSHDGWYDTGETRIVSTGECTEKEQKEQDYREYSCGQGCEFIVSDTRWIDTGNAGNKPEGTACDDGLWCTVSDICTAGVCGGAARDCSANSIAHIETCDNNPDTNPFTWDYRPGFMSVCNEALDICTTGDETISHTCSVDSCGAECDATHSCAHTECDTQDGCYAGTYRDYADVSNICLSGCTCEVNQCTIYTEIITDMDGDGHDIQCDGDCNDSDPTVYVGAKEILDQKDNDCNGQVDDQITIGWGLDLEFGAGNRCPEIMAFDEYHVTTWYNLLDPQDGCAYCDLPTEVLSVLEGGLEGVEGDATFGRSYAFEGELINIKFRATDDDGVIDECTNGYMTVDCGYDPRVVQCKKEVAFDQELDKEVADFDCNYFVGSAEEFNGECWISVSIEDACQQGCSDVKPGIFSVYLNPAVGITYSPQDTPFGFMYNQQGDLLQHIVNGQLVTGPTPGTTAYTPFFTIENSANEETGLYILLQMYGTDFKAPSTGTVVPMCADPITEITSNVLTIENMEYTATHLDAETDCGSEVPDPWCTMPDDPELVFQNVPYANFLGVGDEVTMRLRLNIPSLCQGSFTNGGEVMFVATVI